MSSSTVIYMPQGYQIIYSAIISLGHWKMSIHTQGMKSHEMMAVSKHEIQNGLRYNYAITKILYHKRLPRQTVFFTLSECQGSTVSKKKYGLITKRSSRIKLWITSWWLFEYSAFHENYSKNVLVEQKSVRKRFMQKYKSFIYMNNSWVSHTRIYF